MFDPAAMFSPLTNVSLREFHRVFSAAPAKLLNREIEKQEAEGWTVIPETFRVTGNGVNYHKDYAVVMKKVSYA